MVLRQCFSTVILFSLLKGYQTTSITALRGRGGTPVGETQLEVGLERRGLPTRVAPQRLRVKETREISGPPHAYPKEKEDFYNFDNDYDYEEPQRARPGFNAPSDFKSNFGSFEDFFKGFGGPNQGFSSFLNAVNLNSYGTSNVGGADGFHRGEAKRPQQEHHQYSEQPEFYDYPREVEKEEKPKFTRPEPVYVPQREQSEREHYPGYHHHQGAHNADFRYKEESLYPEFDSESFGDFHEPQREIESDFNNFPPEDGSEFQGFEEEIKHGNPPHQGYKDEPQFESGFEQSRPDPQSFQAERPPPSHQNTQINQHFPPQKPPSGEEVVIFNPSNLNKKRNPIIRPIQTKEPVFSKQNFRNPVKPLRPQNNHNHQLIRIPSIDEGFRPIAKEDSSDFTQFDNSQEIITAPPFPKRRFVNSKTSQTFDVKLGAGFNTRDGEALDSKSFDSVSLFAASKK